MERGAAGAAIIVATNASQELLQPLQARFPQVRFLFCASDSTVFTLRSAGVAAARGQFIVLTEDHCAVGPAWLAALLGAVKRGHAVVGGPIANGLNSRPRQWAIFLSEYAAYAPPVPAGAMRALLAANTAYERRALWECQEVWRSGFFDNEVHDALKASGSELYMEPQAVVSTYLDFSLAGAMAHLHAGGRRFGSYRITRATTVQRILWIVAIPGIVVVLMSRWTRNLFRLPGIRAVMRVQTLLYGALLCVAWATGEARGYLSQRMIGRRGAV